MNRIFGILGELINSYCEHWIEQNNHYFKLVSFKFYYGKRFLPLDGEQPNYRKQFCVRENGFLPPNTQWLIDNCNSC